MPGGRGECGARGRGLISLAPGRSGHHVCRHYDRHARCVAGSGEIVGGVTPAPWTVSPTKPGPDRTKGPHTPWEEPWWNAGRRAVPSRSGDGAAPQGAEGPLRLPAFHFPSFSEAKKPTETTRPPPLPRSVCSRFALHVTEIGGPAGKGACGDRRACIHLFPRAGRGRVSEANEGEGASPRF